MLVQKTLPWKQMYQSGQTTNIACMRKQFRWVWQSEYRKDMTIQRPTMFEEFAE